MDTRERLRAAREKASPRERRNGEANSGGVSAPMTGTIRLTVDLPRAMHRGLRQFALDIDSDASSVVRALLTELSSDHELAGRIEAVIRAARRT